jgi:hypothetical protein
VTRTAGAERAAAGHAVSEPATGSRSLLETASMVIAPFTVITAWFCYFGWVRTNAVFAYFGIDQPLLGFTSQDYLMRSVGSSFRPLLVGLLVLFACLVLRRVLAEVRMRHRFAGIALAHSVCATGAVLVGVGLAGAFGSWPHPEPIRAALSLAIGASLVEVTRTLAPVRGRDLPQRALVWLTVIVGAFWATALHAQGIGTDLARGWAGNVYGRPQVTVYSTTDIGLTGNGVKHEFTGANNGHRYSRLRLLIYSNKKWFLLPESSTGSRPSGVIILPDNDKMRVEVAGPVNRR